MSIVINFKKFALLSLLTVGLAACGRTSSPVAGDKTPTSNSKGGDTSTAPKSGLLASGDPQAVITNARQVLKSQRAYRVRSTSVTSIGGGQTTTSVSEFVAPDRMHNIEEGRESINIGNIMYVRTNGEWQNLGTRMSDMQAKMKDQVQQMSETEKADATKGLTANYKSLGDEILDGVPTAVYEMHSEFDTKVEGVGSIVMITKFWIGKADGLFRKEETDGEEAGTKIKTTKIYEYDPNISIEAPMP